MGLFVRGKIELVGKKDKSHYNFTLKPHEFSMSDTLMINFKKYGFSVEEKRTLSQEYRKNILRFTHLCKDDLYLQAKALIKRLKKLKSDTVEIKASDEGAFVCLVAIFSGELPQDKKFFFTLNCVPLKLIKREYLRKKQKPVTVDIDLRFSRKSWLEALDSLKECPRFLEIQQSKVASHWLDAA